MTYVITSGDPTELTGLPSCSGDLVIFIHARSITQAECRHVEVEAERILVEQGTLIVAGTLPEALSLL